jgi:hypothetical protein
VRIDNQTQADECCCVQCKNAMNEAKCKNGETKCKKRKEKERAFVYVCLQQLASTNKQQQKSIV